MILASGIQLDSKSITKNAFGESLHVVAQQINRVTAYKIDPVKDFKCIFWLKIFINKTFFVVLGLLFACKKTTQTRLSAYWSCWK